MDGPRPNHQCKNADELGSSAFEVSAPNHPIAIAYRLAILTMMSAVRFE